MSDKEERKKISPRRRWRRQDWANLLGKARSAYLRYAGDKLSMARELNVDLKQVDYLITALTNSKDLSINEPVHAVVADSIMQIIRAGHDSRVSWANEMLQELYQSDQFVFSSCCSARTSIETIPDNMGKVTQVNVCKKCGKPCSVTKLSPNDRYTLINELLKSLREENKQLAEIAAKLKYINPDNGDDNMNNINKNNFNIIIDSKEGKTAVRVEATDGATASSPVVDAEYSSASVSDESLAEIAQMQGCEIEAILKSVEQEIKSYAKGDKLRIDHANQSVDVEAVEVSAEDGGNIDIDKLRAEARKIKDSKGAK